MKDTYQRGEIAKEILKGFLVGGLLISCVVLPGMAPILKMVGATSSRDRHRVRQAITQLERRGLLMRRIKNGVEEFVVTKTGKEKLASYRIEDLKIQRSKWDKKWRVLMFDIPEIKARIRREVSFKLKDIGMKAIQNSVFISPFPCKKEIDQIAGHYGVIKYFIYFETDFIECEIDILKEFSLSRR